MKMFSHERTIGKDEWLTPPNILESLGTFDLDPCSPINRPWPTATNHFTTEDDGLSKPWAGRVFLNPPYGNQTHLWIQRLADHNNGIALIFARTETDLFHTLVFPRASSILFLRGRLFFLDIWGTPSKHNAGSPSCLIAYGSVNTYALQQSKLPGKLFLL